MSEANIFYEHPASGGIAITNTDFLTKFIIPNYKISNRKTAKSAVVKIVANYKTLSNFYFLEEIIVSATFCGTIS